MNINRKKQSQFELFPGEAKTAQETGKPAAVTKDLTLSLENIIVLCIIFVMSLVLFFSFGVEKGKKVAAHKGATPVAKQAKAKAPEKAVQVAPQVDEKRVVFPVELPPEVIDESDTDTPQTIDFFEEHDDYYTIQVASFKLKKNAQKEADRLKGIGHDDAFVIPKGNYSIVCVGKFAKRIEARRFSNKLQKRYNDCLVRRM